MQKYPLPRRGRSWRAGMLTWRCTGVRDRSVGSEVAWWLLGPASDSPPKTEAENCVRRAPFGTLAADDSPSGAHRPKSESRPRAFASRNTLQLARAGFGIALGVSAISTGPFCACASAAHAATPPVESGRFGRTEIRIRSNWRRAACVTAESSLAYAAQRNSVGGPSGDYLHAGRSCPRSKASIA